MVDANLAFETMKKIVNESRQLPDGGAQLRSDLSPAEYKSLGEVLALVLFRREFPTGAKFPHPPAT